MTWQAWAQLEERKEKRQLAQRAKEMRRAQKIMR
jgi:hypothetical protein